MSHELSHSLQSAGCANVPVSCHSCDSLLHWIVAWQTTSSEPQFEHTGVERAGRPARSSTLRGTSGIKLNGLMSAVRRIFFILFDLSLSRSLHLQSRFGRLLIATLLTSLWIAAVLRSGDTSPGTEEMRLRPPGSEMAPTELPQPFRPLLFTRFWASP
jgi:hypothetical protein